MADVDIDPFGEHDKIDSHPDETNKTISLTPRGSSWEPECEQETSFGGGKIQERRLTDPYVDSLYKELSKHYGRTSDATHYYNSRREGRWLYFKDRDKSPTNEDGKLITFGRLESILGKNRLRDFDMPMGKVTAPQSVVLKKAEEELPSTSDVANADTIKHNNLQIIQREALIISSQNSWENPQRIYPCKNS